ncbi:MAG TPA: DUF423 domain-containing protein [Hyphomonas sp.]|nr:DUF423 domain-containing protein [Hyphomonas sp.]
MNRLGIFAALTGFLAVALGAFGAHALDGQLTPEGLDWWHTATLYALPHAAAALAISLHAKTGLVRKAGWAFVFGTIVFAGSLYAMALGAPRWFGAITPIGGIPYLVGWACCALGARKA